MDLLNIAASEKLGLDDFTFAAQNSVLQAQYETVNGFIIPANTPYIVTGFGASYSTSTGYLTVNGSASVAGGPSAAGTAFLGYRDSTGQLRYGLVVAQNVDTQQSNLATLPVGTYTAYIRFNLVPGVPQNRAYYSTVNGGYEYAQLTNTRLLAVWELRVESIALGGEWIPVSTITITATTKTVTDARNLYFEGSATTSPAYAPAWGSPLSSNPAGGIADRNATRSNINGGALIQDLHTMIDALKQCIVDIKGPGLQAWYAPGIGGMNVGAAFITSTTVQGSPKDATIAVGDALFGLQGVSAVTGASYPSLFWNGSPAASSNVTALAYSRTLNTMQVVRGGVSGIVQPEISFGQYIGMGRAAVIAPLARIHIQQQSYDADLVMRLENGSTGEFACSMYAWGANPANSANPYDDAVWYLGDNAVGGASAVVNKYKFGLQNGFEFALVPLNGTASGTQVYKYNSRQNVHTFSVYALFNAGIYSNSFGGTAASFQTLQVTGASSLGAITATGANVFSGLSAFTAKSVTPGSAQDLTQRGAQNNIVAVLKATFGGSNWFESTSYNIASFTNNGSAGFAFTLNQPVDGGSCILIGAGTNANATGNPAAVAYTTTNDSSGNITGATIFTVAAGVNGAQGVSVCIVGKPPGY